MDKFKFAFLPQYFVREFPFMTKRACVLLVGLFAFSAVCEAQFSDYLYSWAPRPETNPASVDYGYVEQADGHLHLEIPIGTPRQNRSGSGKTQVRLVYDSNFWYPNSFMGTTYSWYPGQSWRLLPTSNFTGYQHFTASSGQTVSWGTDTNGVRYTFPCFSGCYANEGSGEWLYDWGIYGADGTYKLDFSYGGAGDEATTDPNGNYLKLTLGEDLPRIIGRQAIAEYFDTSNIPFFYAYETGLLGTSFNAPGPYVDDFYTVPNMNSAGAEANYVVHEVTIQVNSSFNMTRLPVAECTNTSSSNDCFTQVISQIILPDQTSFTFKYDCDSTVSGQQSYCSSPGGRSLYTGGLSEMHTPTGGTYTYSYQPYLDSYGDGALGLSSHSNGEGTWYYSQYPLTMCSHPTDVGCQQVSKIVEPNGRTTITVNTLNNGPWPTNVTVTDGAGNNLSSTTTQWDFSHPDQWLGHGSAYIRKQWEKETEWDDTGAAKSRMTSYFYDSAERGNITRLYQWGYRSGTNPSFPAPPDIATYTDYYAPSNSPITGTRAGWTYPQGGTNIVRPQKITVCNSDTSNGADPDCPVGGKKVSQKIISYDQYGSSGPQLVSGVANHNDQSYGGTQIVRGNPTQIYQWTSGGQYVYQSNVYDTTGQITASTDGNLNTTTYDYTDRFYVDNGTSSPAPYTPLAPTHAHATTITLPTVNGNTYSKTMGYYYGNQKIAVSTDINGNSTYYHYADPLDRLTQTVNPIGWTLTQYTSPTQRDMYQALTSTSPSSSCTGCLHTAITYDALQRTAQTMNADGSKVDISYNNMGFIQSISNRYKTLTDPTRGTTTYLYDVRGRVCLQGNPDNNTGSPTLCTSQGSSVQTFSYVLNGGSKKDELGHIWTYGYDGRNHLSTVAEPIGHTQYTFDVSGNLQNVIQGGIVDGTAPVTRSFTYDGLSRLITANNAETGTVCYGQWSGGSPGNGVCQNGYDGNSNLLYKTDARGITTSYVYDQWNRLIRKTTPVVINAAGATSGYVSTCYQYDTNGGSTTGTNLAGHLVAEWTQAGNQCASSYTPSIALTAKIIVDYDAMGRPLHSQQCVKAMCTTQPFVQSQTYDLAGNLTSWQDGLGRMTFVLPFDTSNHPTDLTNSYSGNGLPSVLFSAQGFSALGGLQDWKIGNLLNVNQTYDNRGRITGKTVTH